MRNSEWPQEYLDLKQVEIRNNEVRVKSSRGFYKGLACDTAIVDAQWINDAVVITYRNGTRVRYYSPYMRESL